MFKIKKILCPKGHNAQKIQSRLGNEFAIYCYACDRHYESCELGTKI